MNLQEYFEKNPVVALGFSGGVDSSYLLYAGLKYKAKIKPYFIKTAFQPQFELDDARKLARQLKADLTVIEFDVLSQNQVTINSAQRCYYCKTVLFTQLSQQARADGYMLLIDGTNASDDVDDRPGMRALTELAVQSPLRLCGLTKTNVRQLSREAGLFTWNKPAYACLATRVPTDTEITAEILNNIELSERVLFGLGFTDFRVRLLGKAARIELPADQLELLLQKRDIILAELKPRFQHVLLDLTTR